mmetsp:Transcript_6126/g.14680  ORF Transcript_6126/g.14680 Transcript_6126/m.14680 type:complete len:173 (+) Transcript_6126:249-767(+)
MCCGVKTVAMGKAQAGQGTSPAVWAVLAVVGAVLLTVMDHQLNVESAEGSSFVDVEMALGALVIIALGATASRMQASPPKKILAEEECCDDISEVSEEAESQTSQEQMREPCARWNAGACKARPGQCRFAHYCTLCNNKKARHRALSRFCPHSEKRKFMQPSTVSRVLAAVE